MSLIEAIAKRGTLLGQYGKIGLHSLYPNDFEIYICAFELTDSEDNVLKYFSFPVMPSQISMDIKNLTNITKTAGGLSILNDPKFNPIDINISGSFGRSMKLILNNNLEKSAFTAYNDKKFSLSNLKNVVRDFDSAIKSGYGCCKIVEDIFNESKKMDNGKLRKLYFHNLSFNALYMVEVDSLRFSQSQESNMIWNYAVKMTAVAPYLAFNSSSKQKRLSTKIATRQLVQDILDQASNLFIKEVSKSLTIVVSNPYFNINKVNASTYNPLDEVRAITNSPNIGNAALSSNDFFNNHYEKVFNYYSGKTTTIPKESILEFEKLKKSVSSALYDLDINKDKFNNLEGFDLQDKLNTVKRKLLVLDNADKWSRSSVNKDNLQDSKVSGYTLSQGEQLENILPNEEGLNLGIENKILETDYNLDGGAIVKNNIPYSNNQLDFSTLEVIDVINENTIYGKDIDKNFTLVDEDISVVEGIDCLKQAADILTQLFKTNNKRYLDQGIDKNFIVGSNRNDFSFPVVYRQILENFSTDSCFKDVNLVKYLIDKDNIFLELELTTIKEDLLTQKTAI